MSRLLLCVVTLCSLFEMATGADQTYSEKAIAKAIGVLETERDKANDLLEQARIDKAIRELEALISDPDGDSKPSSAKPPVVKYDVKPANLKKKFGGRASLNGKTGELTLVYDFSNKNQLADFDTKGTKFAVTKNVLLLDGSEKVTHIAKFKAANLSTVMLLNSMRGSGISSSSNNHFYTGGDNPDTIYVNAATGERTSLIVPGDVRKGPIPVTFEIMPDKVGLRYAQERLMVRTVETNDVHQFILKAGPDGCGFSNLVISGIPDAEWFKEFLEAQ